MKIQNKIILLAGLIIFSANPVFAQLKFKIISDNIYISDGSIVFKPSKYIAKTDSLANILKKHPKDTIVLFTHAVLVLKANDQLAKPHPSISELKNLQMANAEADTALKTGMTDIRLKVLRAQLLKSLAYQYSADERWQFSKDQIQSRRSAFLGYQNSANMEFDNLANLDVTNAYDYQKQKTNNAYPIQ